MRYLNNFSQFINESESSDLENYKKMLNNHDWAWHLQDDYKSWKEGSEEADEIQNAYSKLDPRDKKIAHEYWMELRKKKFPKETIDADFTKFRGY